MSERDRVRQVAVVLAAAAQVVGAALYPLGLAPMSVGGRTEPVSTPVVPAGYAFSIWGVIFVLGLVFAVWQALPRNAGDPLLRRLGWPVAATFTGNALWETMAQYGAPDAPLALLLALIVGAALVARQALVRWPEPATAGRWWRVDLPIGLTAGWVSAAFFAACSTALQAAVQRSSGVPANGYVWVLLIAAAALFAVRQLLGARGPVAYAAGVAWAFVGIAVANAGAGNRPALIAALAGVAAVALATLLGRRSRRGPAAATTGVSAPRPVGFWPPCSA